MSVQIIIVNYNAGEWLKRSIGSALEHSNGKVTVVDNASQDESVEQAKTSYAQEPRLKFVMNSSNVGFAAANNQVLASLQDDYAVLMNPDCELRENTLDNIINALQDNHKIALASCRILNEDGSIQKTCKRKFPTPKTALIRLLGLRRLFPNSDFDYGESYQANNNVSVETVEAISGAFMVVRKSALDQVGLLDQGYFMHCEDLDWCKRFQLHGWEVGFVNNAEVIHAKGVSSKKRPIGVLWNLHCGMDRYFSKFHTDQAWPLKVLIKAGIYLSFLPRALASLIRR